MVVLKNIPLHKKYGTLQHVQLSIKNQHYDKIYHYQQNIIKII